MQTMTLQEIANRNPGISVAEIGELLDELDEIPRRKKRRYNLALPGTRFRRYYDTRAGFCPRCFHEASRRRRNASGHSRRSPQWR